MSDEIPDHVPDEFMPNFVAKIEDPDTLGYKFWDRAEELKNAYRRLIRDEPSEYSALFRSEELKYVREGSRSRMKRLELGLLDIDSREKRYEREIPKERKELLVRHIGALVDIYDFLEIDESELDFLKDF